MLLEVRDVFTEVKKRIEETVGKEFKTSVNIDRKKENPNHYYFIFNDDLNIEIAIFYGERNGITDKSILQCLFQKPFTKNEKFDFINNEKGIDYIVSQVEKILKKD